MGIFIGLILGIYLVAWIGSCLQPEAGWEDSAPDFGWPGSISPPLDFDKIMDPDDSWFGGD